MQMLLCSAFPALAFRGLTAASLSSPQKLRVVSNHRAIATHAAASLAKVLTHGAKPSAKDPLVRLLRSAGPLVLSEPSAQRWITSRRSAFGALISGGHGRFSVASGERAACVFFLRREDQPPPPCVSLLRGLSCRSLESEPWNSRSSTCAFSTRSISGRLFYKRRPLQVPRLKPPNYRSKWLEGAPHKKGICVKVRVQTPRKPNSGLRKVARVRLSTGRTVLVYIPGSGHSLNVHSSVLVRGGRCPDVPGCNYKAVRGVYDLLPVRNRKRKRSKYGVKLSSADKEHRQQRWSHRFLFTSSDRTFFNQFLWATWRDKEGQPLLRKLEESETPSPHMRWFNRWFRLKMQRTGGTARD